MSRVNQYRLWTPIANAFEAYRRPLITEPKAFDTKPFSSHFVTASRYLPQKGRNN